MKKLKLLLLIASTLFSFVSYAQIDDSELNKYSLEVLENTQRYLDYEAISPIVLLDSIWPKNQKVKEAFDEFDKAKKTDYCLYWKEGDDEHLLIEGNSVFVYFHFVSRSSILLRAVIYKKKVDHYLKYETFVNMQKTRMKVYSLLIELHTNGKKDHIGSKIVEMFDMIETLKDNECKKGFIQKLDIPKNVINYIEKSN